jgi:DNA/RNA-binding protein KIN17
MADEGIIELDETEKGIFIRWVDNSPETLMRQEAIARKERLDKSEEERNARLLEEQIEKAKASASQAEAEYTELKRDTADEPIKLKMDLKPVAPKAPLELKKLSSLGSSLSTSSSSSSSTNAFSNLATKSSISTKPSWMTSGVSNSKPSQQQPVKKLSAMEQIMEDEKRKRSLKEQSFPSSKRIK